MDISVNPVPSETERAVATLRPSQVVGILRRSFGLILICGVLAAIVAYGFAKSRPARYSAGATIAIEGQTFAIPELQGAVHTDSATDPMPAIRTEAQALMSREIVQSVIVKLGLERLPEFNPALRPPTWLDTLRGRLQQAIPGWRPKPRPGGGSDDAVMNAAFRALVVSQDNRSFVIGVTFTSEDPVLAARFVNALVDTYVASRAQRRAGANRDANAEMLQRVDDVRVGLEKLQDQMRDLRTKDELVGLRAGSIGQQQVEDLASAAARASLERAELEARWQQAQTLVQRGLSVELDNVLASPTIARLREQESQASQHLADLQSHYGPNYPGVRSAQANATAARGQVAAEAQRIVAGLAGQLAVARAHETDAQRQLQAAREVSVTSENAQARLNDLQEEVNAQRALYQSLLQGAQKTIAQATNATPTLDVRVLSPAVPPADPSSPKPKLAAAMGGAGGLVLGVLLGLIRAQTRNTVISIDDVTDVTGLPVAMVLRCGRNTSALLARVRAEPMGQEADSLRLLRARIRAAGQPSPPRSVLFVSLDDDREAAVTAAALGHVMAGDGAKVMVAEGNLRDPCLGQVLGVSGSGLLDVLEGEQGWYDARLIDPAARLDVLVTQRPAVSPQALISGPHFQNLLMDLQDAYQLTILNGASALSSDTLALAQEVSVTVLIVRVGKASRTAARDASLQIASVARCPPLIAVIAAA